MNRLASHRRLGWLRCLLISKFSDEQTRNLVNVVRVTGFPLAEGLLGCLGVAL